MYQDSDEEMENRFSQLFYGDICQNYGKVKVLGQEEIPLDCENFKKIWKVEVKKKKYNNF